MGWAIRTCAIVMCLMVGRGHASSASGETGASAPGGPALLDRIRVVVNGQPITQNQIEFYRAYLTMMDGGGLGRPRPVPDMEQLSSSELLELVIDLVEPLEVGLGFGAHGRIPRAVRTFSTILKALGSCAFRSFGISVLPQK